ncbi:ribonuclease H-like domain, reverse transcriptase, RNA-dependent DNA polymerase, partial [Tanacetum coccineum]
MSTVEQRVEENLHVQFSENTPNIAGSGPNWLFDIDALTKSINYKSVVTGNQSNVNTGQPKLGLWYPKYSSFDLVAYTDSAYAGESLYRKSTTGGCKKDKRGIVINNKARLVAQGYTQEEGIHYDKVFAPVSRIEAIRLFLAYASFKDFMVYQMDVKSAFLYGKIEKEVYVYNPPRFEDLDFPDRVSERTNRQNFVYQEGPSDVKIANIPMETHKPLLKDVDGEDIDEHMYRSMIGSLMYLTSSRPDIMFVVCVCARFQVNPKISHLHAVKRIFRYLKGQPKLGLWYPKDSPFDLVAYTDSDYAGASLDRNSTIGGCQFLRCRLISWQCKKQIVVANSTTEAEYVAASSCCGQKGIGVNAGNSKLMLLGINLLLLEKVNVARHNLLLLVWRFTKNIRSGKGVWCGEEQVKRREVGSGEGLHALVDRKKVIITESTIRRDLQLEDAKAQEEMGKGSANPIDPHHTPIITQSSTSKPQKKQKPRKPNRKYTKIPQSSSPTEHIADEAANEENLPTHSNDPLLSEISSLKLRVKRLEKKRGSRTHKLKRLFKVSRSTQVVSSENEGLGDQEDESKQGRKIDDIGKDAEDVVEKEISTADPITTAAETVTTASVEVSASSATLVSAATTTTTTTITGVDLTLAQALAKLRSAKPKI